VGVFMLAKITYIYWQIECIPKTLIWMIVWAYKNYLHLLAGWMHFKFLICTIVQSCKNYLHLLVNWVHSITYI
jgi:hypothetical protein